jgi:hypothetical protein
VTTVEDRLRAATRAAAHTVAPGSAPPLHLPDQPARQRRHWWASRLTPLAAAAAVTAVIAGTLTISGAIHSSPPGPVAGASGQIPPYYVALPYTGDGQCCSPGRLFNPRTYAVVRATRTGAVLATITPPKPYGTFAGVAAAADDRTFVLAAQRDGRIPRNFRKLQRSYPPATTFFMLHFNPASTSAGGLARLTPLRIAAEPVGFSVANFALSPRGTSLAVSSNSGQLQVFSLATGARRTWQPAYGGAAFPYRLVGAANALLSWQGEHTLAFVWDGLRRAGGGRLLGRGADGVRLLDTRAPGAGLLADSRLVQPRSAIGGDAFWRQILPTADGRTLITVVEAAGTKASPGLKEKLTEVALGTGTARVLNHLPGSDLQGGYETVLWASPSGRALIVSGTRPARNPPAGSFFLTGARVLTPGRSTPIPWPNRTFAAAW